MKKQYIVIIRENSHYMDEEEEYKHGDFDSCEEAVAACKRIVDDFLEPYEGKKLTSKSLWEVYTLYGEDPFIISDDKGCRFYAWDYAKKRCDEIGS